MPCYTRMKTIFLQGVIWLCLWNFGIVLSAVEPGYLDFDNLPDTNFSCVGKVIGGYYADLETNCQMFHVCTIGQLDEPMDIRFLCLNGTVFDQETRVCERVDEVDCSKSERFYHLNLELYGNTAPPILEDSNDTEPPIISSTTSTTTTLRPTTTIRTTRATYYTTPAPTLPPTTHSTPKVITSNQFPIHSGPDIRFNPEEINIRLTPGSPPIIKSPGIKSPSVSYQQQTFNGGDARITVTTHTAVYKDNKDRTSQKTISNLSPSTQKPKSIVSYGLTHSNNQQMYHQHKPKASFDYTSYQQTENSDIDYHTDLPSSEYAYPDNDQDPIHMGLNYDQMNYQPSNKKPQTQIFSVSSTTKRPNQQQSFVSSTPYSSNIKSQQQFSFQRTEKPPSLQLPLPLFPTLPPLTFSSPAPFSLTRHFETKRSNDHQQRPRIIVSASASVSDASGRRLNYSLGTIGTSHLIPKAPNSYDEYKEGDVGLDPFYHDVPKVKNTRQKRDLENYEITPEGKQNITTTEKTVEETTHWVPPEYVDDNYEPLTYNANIGKNLTDPKNDTNPSENEYEYYYEYVDDNYEPSLFDDFKDNVSESILATTEVVTQPTVELTTQETTLELNTVTEPIDKVTTQISLDRRFDFEENTTDATTTILPEITTTDLTTTDLNEISTTENVVETTSFITTTTEQPETTTEFNYDTTITTTDVTSTTIQETTTFSPIETTTISQIETTTNIPTETTSFEEGSTIETTTNAAETTTLNVETTTIEETTTTTTTTSRNRYNYLRTREPAYKRNSKTRPTTRHRFSSPSIHISPSLLKVGNKMVNSSLDSKSEESITSKEVTQKIKTNRIVTDSKHLFTTVSYNDVPITEATISKSANPTEPKTTVGSSLLTTPITKTLFIPRRFTYDITRSFNCFGKEMNKFYEDPRDCRLFHYCTPGYTETQVLDMKYVCDYGTYFDSDKLICTKIKPQRCK